MLWYEPRVKLAWMLYSNICLEFLSFSWTRLGLILTFRWPWLAWSSLCRLVWPQTYKDPPPCLLFPWVIGMCNRAWSDFVVEKGSQLPYSGSWRSGVIGMCHHVQLTDGWSTTKVGSDGPSWSRKDEEAEAQASTASTSIPLFAISIRGADF